MNAKKEIFTLVQRVSFELYLLSMYSAYQWRISKYLFATIASLLLFCSACKKTTIYEQETVEVVIEGNEIADYNEVPSILIENYVNKAFVDLLGRQPTASELEENVEFLKTNSLSTDSRLEMANSLINTDTFFSNFYDRLSAELLDGGNEEEIQFIISLLELNIGVAILQNDLLQQQLLEYEKLRLELLLSATPDFRNGEINIQEFHRRFLLNAIYDEINMGSENFVLAVFEQLFNRMPTEAELESSVSMVDGNPAFFFLRDGRNKGDFIQIAIESDAFYEGLVTDIFQWLLNRTPTSSEALEGTNFLLNTGSFVDLQAKVISTDEYAGF